MDSYEYYLMFHQNQDKFLAKIEPNNQEILIALRKLSANKKIQSENKQIAMLIIDFIKVDTNANYLLDEILLKIITPELYREAHNFVSSNDFTLPKLRIINIFSEYGLMHSLFDENLQKFGELITESLFKEVDFQSHCVSALIKFLRNINSRNFILELCIRNSIKFCGSVSMQNLCFIWKELCQSDLKYRHEDIIDRYLEHESMQIKKQGVFLVKCLLDSGFLQDVSDDWRRFISIFDSLEENQSHLILPTLELLYEIRNDDKFDKYWFILCSIIINHENTLVKKFGLNYIFGICKQNYKRDQVVTILEALNYTHLFEPTEIKFIENVRSFIESNLDFCFEVLHEINWCSVPFYYVLKFCCSLYKPNDSHIKYIEKQTEIIPKQIKNIKIRGLIKELYADLLEKVMHTENLGHILPSMYNIFAINDNQSCLENCLDQIRREDYSLIFSTQKDYEFVKFILFKTHVGRAMDEIKTAAEHVENNQKLIMEVMIDMNNFTDGYEDIHNIFINDSIEFIWQSLISNDLKRLNFGTDLLEIATKASKVIKEIEILDHLSELWMKISALYGSDSNYEYSFLKLSSIILRYNRHFNLHTFEKSLRENKQSVYYLQMLTLCQVLVMRNNRIQESENSSNMIETCLENLEILIDISSSSNFESVYEIIEIIALNLSEISLQNQILLDKLKNIIRNFISTSIKVLELSVEFWKRFIDLLSNSLDKYQYSTVWVTALLDIFNDIELSLSESQHFGLLQAILEFLKNNFSILPKNKLYDHFEQILCEAIYNIHVMSRDEQIENSLLSRHSTTSEEIRRKINFRLHISKFFAQTTQKKFSIFVGEKILEFAAISKNKARYYPNSKIHRLKLRHFQPLVFCDNIDENVKDVLIHELLFLTNAKNITYILEIIVARHFPNILNLLKTGKDLNSQALKSIFSVSIMQMKSIKEFNAGEEFLKNIFEYIFPFAMGQNFGVRSYAFLTIFISFQHVQNLRGYTKTPIIKMISNICDLILESVKQKNSLKYFNALQNDFRFTRSLEDLSSYKIFYGDIPLITNMSFEEILLDGNEAFENFVAADMFKENECIVMTDELEFPPNDQNTKAITNLQRKYLPFKNQIPTESLLRTLPTQFKTFDDDEGVLRSKSELILVASLIDNNTNLGGLARTCEVFGISKYVIHSLNSQDNFEFKSLSRTSEKWIHICEVKEWQLFDYLVGMKSRGYTIAGGEQTEHSISLIDAKFPKKCVFLLGNEKKGIPSDLLSLLDLVIEIPQTGVVRSLNVHVAGAILIWEYARQHIFR